MAARAGLAGAWGDSLEVRGLRRAVALDPGNAELHFNLGTVYLWGEGGDAEAASQELLAATRLSPQAAAHWSALGKACYAAGKRACADQAFERAAALSPAKPRFAWEAALHYAVTRRPLPAVPHWRRFLRLQPQRAAQVFELARRTSAGPEFVWRELLSSAGVELRLEYLAFLAGGGQARAAERFWEEVAAETGNLPAAAARDFVEQLLRAGEYGAAVRVWAQLERAGVVAAGGASERLVNGGFEQPLTQTGFEWHLQPQSYLALAVEQYARGNALRVEFTVPQNGAYEPAYRFVPVVPGQQYLLSASIRSENITSDSGPRLQVAAPQCPGCLEASTAGATGTAAWHRTELRFTAPAQAEVIRLSLCRPPSRSFPMEISGRFWLDDVSLRPLPGAQPRLQ